MVDDIDIYRTAKLLIDQRGLKGASDHAADRIADLLDEHGDTAPIFAAMEADAMLDAGDLDGAATWRRILDAVRQMQSRKPGGTVH